MENFFSKNIETQIQERKDIKSFEKIYIITRKQNIKYWLLGILFLLIIVLFLPWTQNIRALGTVTTLLPEQRPQQVNTYIAGKVKKWYVREGQYVNKGDTILQLDEIKVEYLDPNLVARTQDQLEAKSQSINEYENKANTSNVQVDALNQARELKLSSIDNYIGQQMLKIASDSADLVAVRNQLSVYRRQMDAAKIMLDSGAISLVDFEKRKINIQDGEAKLVAQQNKLSQSKQQLINLRIEKNSAVQEYTDKISKAQGDRFSALSSAASTRADVSKLQNQRDSYVLRNGLYYILAPQSGQITKSQKAGIGEIVKEGEMIVEIVPTQMQYAVEMYVSPTDLPLVNVGQNVRFIFDGFPAIVFSGWPNTSYGTYSGKIAAVETSVSTNGKFRVLAIEDTTNHERKWPPQLRMGGGANGIALLKVVPIYYELWRNINGFPPEFYTPASSSKDKSKK